MQFAVEGYEPDIGYASLAENMAHPTGVEVNYALWMSQGSGPSNSRIIVVVLCPDKQQVLRLSSPFLKLYTLYVRGEGGGIIPLVQNRTFLIR